MTLQCPKGMVLIPSGGSVQPDEPTYCIAENEVSQKEDQEFWAKRQKSGCYYELVLGINKIRPLGKLIGPNKPAFFRTWNEARIYCQATYPGGDLPTNRQWDKACDDNDNKSIFKHTLPCDGKSLYESKKIYGIRDIKDVGSTPNRNGIRDMKGNVWEWTRNASQNDRESVRGGNYHADTTQSEETTWGDGTLDFYKGLHVSLVGFRCAAEPQGSGFSLFSAFKSLIQENPRMNNLYGQMIGLYEIFLTILTTRPNR